MRNSNHIELIYDALNLVGYEEHDEPLGDLGGEPLDQVMFVVEAAVRVAQELLTGGDAAGGMEYLRERIGEDERAEQQAIQLGELLVREARLCGPPKTLVDAEDDIIALKSQLECHLATLAKTNPELALNLAAAAAEDVLEAVEEVTND